MHVSGSLMPWAMAEEGSTNKFDREVRDTLTQRNLNHVFRHVFDMSKLKKSIGISLKSSTHLPPWDSRESTALLPGNA
jgi:hypothetical protein